MALEAQSGTDPRAAAAEFAQQAGIALQGGRELKIGGFAAYQAVAEASTQNGARIAVDLTWIAHPQLMFRITGQSLAEKFRSFEPRFRATAESVRTLTRQERASITEKRIHLVRAKSGETLEALSRRTQNAWSVEETASANAHLGECASDRRSPGEDHAGGPDSRSRTDPPYFSSTLSSRYRSSPTFSIT